MRSQLMTVSTTLALAVVVTATPRVVSAAGCPWDIVDANRGEKTDPWESAWMSPCWSTAPPPSEELRPPDPPPSDLPPLAPLASDPLSPGSTLRSGESLLVDQVRRSADGRYTLVYQGDGNLVLLDGSTPVWATGTQDTTPGVAAMQGDGNFVIYNHQGQAVCASGTVGEAGAFLEVQTDGNVVLYRADGVQLRDRHTAVPSLCDPLSSPPSLPAPSPPPLPPPPNEPPSTGEEEVIYFHTDAIGSVRLITDAAGAVVSRHDFQAFGPDMDNADQPNDPSIRLQFAGKERDVETDAHGWTALDYFGARYYTSMHGRFTTVDPVLNIEAALTDPQRWNRYAYARSNPLLFVDPDGREIYRVVTPYERELMGMAGAIRDKVATALGADSTAVQHPLAVFGRNVIDSLLATVLPRDVGEAADAASAAMLGALGPVRGPFLGTTYTEARTLVGAWDKGSLKNLAFTIRYHFERHGSEVEARTILQYLRKAFEFSRNLRGATRKYLDDGAIRYEKNGRYIIKDAEGNILSFGEIR